MGIHTTGLLLLLLWLEVSDALVCGPTCRGSDCLFLSTLGATRAPGCRHLDRNCDLWCRLLRCNTGKLLLNLRSHRGLDLADRIRAVSCGLHTTDRCRSCRLDAALTRATAACSSLLLAAILLDQVLLVQLKVMLRQLRLRFGAVTFLAFNPRSSSGRNCCLNLRSILDDGRRHCCLRW